MTKLHYIKEIMQEKGLSVSELAKLLGVTQQAVSNQINHNMRLSSAKKIADVLGVSLQDLFCSPKNMPKQEFDIRNVELKCPKCGSTLTFAIKTKTPLFSIKNDRTLQSHFHPAIID